MADAKISQLPSGNPLAPTDLVPVAQDIGGGNYTTIQASMSAVSIAIANEVADDFVNVTGDTMTGNLVFDNAADTWSIVPEVDGTLSIAGSTYDQILALNPGTATGTNTGQTITGRFRYSMPILVEADAAIVTSGSTGVTTGLIRVNEATAATITIRDNVGDNDDFDPGNFFSVMQEGAGQVTIEAENADVVLRIPSGYIAATREQYSVISATLFDITGATQTWVISGDLATAP